MKTCSHVMHSYKAFQLNNVKHAMKRFNKQATKTEQNKKSEEERRKKSPCKTYTRKLLYNFLCKSRVAKSMRARTKEKRFLRYSWIIPYTCTQTCVCVCSGAFVVGFLFTLTFFDFVLLLFCSVNPCSRQRLPLAHTDTYIPCSHLNYRKT